MNRFRYSCLLPLLLLCNVYTSSGEPVSIPDSSIYAINRLPRAQQDLAYIALGQYFYHYHDEASLERALLCYLEALSIAQASGHTKQVIQLSFYIGSVYDALNIIPKATLYYERYYRALAAADPQKWRAAYNLAIIYWKANDSSRSGHYLDTMHQLLPVIPDGRLRQKYQLILANACLKINRKEHFLQYFGQLPEDIHFHDSDLAYGRIFAEASSNYIQLQGGHHNAIMQPLMQELAQTRDSGEVLHLIVKKLGALKEYEDYFRYSQLYEQVSLRNKARLSNNDYELMLDIEKARQYALQKSLKQENKKSELTSKVLFLTAISLLAGLGIMRYLLLRNKRRQQLLQIKNNNIATQNEQIKLLIREIHHRVKNNMQIVNSLIELQLTKQSDTKDALRELQVKMQSIGLAHEMMYAADNSADVLPLKHYLQRIVDAALQVLGPETQEDIRIDWAVDERIVCGLDKIILIAIIINELITNSIKYVLPVTDQPVIRISGILMPAADICTIGYADNGPGLPEGIDPLQQNTLGQRLIRNLVKQLNAKLNINNKPEYGLEYNIKFSAIIHQTDQTFKI